MTTPQRLSWGCSLAFLLAAYLSAQRPANQSSANLQEAQRAFDARQYRQSAAFAQLFASTTPDPQARTAALLLQGKSLVNLEDFAAAETPLRALQRQSPPSAEALYLLGYVLERENQPRDSLIVFTAAAALAPPQPDDLKLVALDYVLLEDYPDAIHWLNRCLVADPANEEAWYFLGRAQMQVGDFLLADQDFRKALALSARDSKALDNLGLALEGQNRPEDAAESYRQAIAAQQSAAHPSEQPLLNLATLLNNQNRSAEALPLLQQAVNIAPRSVRCQEELSRAYTATGAPQQGIAAMQRASALEPANPRLHFRLSQLYRRNGLSAQAEAEAQLSTRLYASHSTDRVH